jgi:hypothetical protein
LTAFLQHIHAVLDRGLDGFNQTAIHVGGWRHHADQRAPWQHFHLPFHRLVRTGDIFGDGIEQSEESPYALEKLLGRKDVAVEFQSNLGLDLVGLCCYY